MREERTIPLFAPEVKPSPVLLLYPVDRPAELAPCATCGHMSPMYRHEGGYSVTCLKCRVDVIASTKEETIELWNRRNSNDGGIIAVP